MYRQPFKGSYPITLGFGEEFLPLYKAGEHKGVDYGCPEGTPILASDDGVVIQASYQPNGYGNYIILAHSDGSGTVYAHLRNMLVKKYQQVKKGEQIGISGATGKATGPHLHYELRTKAADISTVINPVARLQSVLDTEPIDSTLATVKPQFEAVREGLCVVVCDEANVRCHCDMNRIIKTLKKGQQIYISPETTMRNGLPYRKYWDLEKLCFLMIAEHDPDTQILMNVDPYNED